MGTFDEAEWRRELLRARDATLASFRDPQRSPYAVVARHEFAGERPLVFGSAEDCDAPLEGLAPHGLRARVSGNFFECESIDPGSPFFIAGKPGAGEPLTKAQLAPGARIQLGRYQLRFSHQNFPAVLVIDPQSPRLAGAELPRWFEPDPAFRIEARLERDPSPREEIVLSTRGQRRRGLKLGALVFELPGDRATQRLTALRLLEPGSDESGFSIFFRDATTGNESYPVGRYLEPKPIREAGDPEGDSLAARWLLDFNGAYNPGCAFSPLFNCPIPPRENRLQAAVRAGERDPHADRSHP